jgi:hypothetical protein
MHGQPLLSPDLPDALGIYTEPQKASEMYY